MVTTRANKRKYSEKMDSGDIDSEVKQPPTKKARLESESDRLRKLLEQDPTSEEVRSATPISRNMYETDVHITINNYIDSHNYFIPESFPQLFRQKGPCCGLYALHGALQYGYPDQKIPPPRKSDTKTRGDKISLRQIAKQKGFTAFGEIFDVNSLHLTATHFNFATEVMPFNKTENSYVESICNKLKQGGSVVVAFDAAASGFPCKDKGLGTHWALVFGFFNAQNQIYFLMTQWTKYYVVSASILFQSNDQLPIENPRRGPDYFFCKDEQGSHYLPSSSEVLADASIKKRFAIGNDLKNFAYGCLFVPAKKTNLDLSLEVKANKLKKS